MHARFQGVEAQARRLAKKRNQPLSTAHLLRVLPDSDTTVAGLLSGHGASEIELIRASSSLPEEATHAADLASERADRLALELHGQGPGPLHLLLCLLRDPRSAALQLLNSMGVPLAALTAATEAALGAGSLVTTRIDASVGAAQPLSALSNEQRKAHTAQNELAARIESSLAAGRREPRLPMAAAWSPLPEAAVREHQDEPESSLATDAAEAAPARGTPEASNGFDASLALEESQTTEALLASLPQLDAKRFPLLTSLGRDLTREALAGRIDPVLGRDNEIEQLLDVLARRRANNPVLVGPPGVGKTAIAEGLALRLVEDAYSVEELPMLLEISAGALVSGTGVRGALSERLNALRAELREAPMRVLLFIDEIHALVGQGEGPDSLANELKAGLARGELPCIGATTDVEYTRIFERDAALARRFTRVEVEEPSASTALDILRGVSLEYEKHHSVAYTPQALSSAVDLSVRYLPEGRLPDKAIGLMDRAAARVQRRGARVVDVEDVAQVVSEQCSVGVERLLMRDGDALLQLEELLAERVVGQPEVVRSVAAALRKSAAGFRGERPLGTFMFLGPTGVGKTELAKAVSDLVFPGIDMTRLDMAEFGESHTTARLLGSPPGYVGHDEGGQLTEAVRHRPYQLVLLDEIEKAHPDVLLSLLSLLDEGRLTDSRGRTVDFRNTVVVMTTNLGADARPARARIGFSGGSQAQGREASAQAAADSARSALPPELWNRIDEPLYFHPLGRSDVARIALRMVEQAAETVRTRHHVDLRVEDSAIDVLIEQGGYEPALGARPMKRTVGRLVEAPLAEAVLSGRLREGGRVVLRGRQGELCLDVAPEAQDAAQ